MISAPKDIFGPNAFEMFVHELGMARVSTILEVTPATVRRWMRGTTAVPRMAVLALYWETQYGRSLIESEMVNEIRLLYQRNRILQEQFTRAKDIVTGLRRLHAGTANEPIFEELIDCHENEEIQAQFGAPRSRKHTASTPAHPRATEPESQTLTQARTPERDTPLQKAAAA